MTGVQTCALPILLELDPTNSQGPTNLGIVYARQGKLDEAEKLVEDARERFKRDNLFLYNAACVYGRALEFARGKNDLPNRDDLLLTRMKKRKLQLKDQILQLKMLLVPDIPA